MAENEENPMQVPEQPIDEAEIRRLEGDARERMGLPRERPAAAPRRLGESFSVAGQIPVGPRWLKAVQEPKPPSPEEHARRRRERRLDRLALAGVPERYAGLSLASPELSQRVQAPSAILATERALDAPGLVFVGNSASGKTTLACAALTDWVLARGGEPFFIPCRELAAARMAHSLGEGEASLVDRAVRADILILDDLGVGDDAHRSAVGDVIDSRYDHMRLTWYTTSFDAAKIAGKYGEGRSRRVFAKPNVIIACGKRKP